MLGIGDPSALQFNVTGSWRGTVVSIGCSVIRGICKAANEKIRMFWLNFWIDEKKTRNENILDMDLRSATKMKGKIYWMKKVEKSNEILLLLFLLTEKQTLII